ncbi:MAG: helix-turn-helix domain-containing protein, partial [Geminicoccaceae bacterium]
MSSRKVDRAEVLARLDDGRLDAQSAAKIIGVSERHIFRLLKAFRQGGASSLNHQHRGRRSNNRISDSLRKDVLALIRKNYVGFGPTHIANELLERKDIKLSRETLRSWMIEAGLWLPKGERKGSKQALLHSDKTIEAGNRDRGNIAGGRKLLNRRAFSKKALDVAESLVVKGGLNGLNMRELADGVGCSIGTLYNICGNLDGIIQALNARTLDRLYHTLEEVSRSATGPESQMIALANAYIDFAESQPAVWRAIFDHQHVDVKAVPD